MLLAKHTRKPSNLWFWPHQAEHHFRLFRVVKNNIFNQQHKFHENKLENNILTLIHTHGTRLPSPNPENEEFFIQVRKKRRDGGKYNPSECENKAGVGINKQIDIAHILDTPEPERLI